MLIKLASTTSSATADGTASGAPPKPLDLSHHYSRITKNRQASKIKAFYRFGRIPGISNFSGGMPNVKYFPYDTLEAKISKADRWETSPNYPEERLLSGANGTPRIAGANENGLLPNPDFEATSERLTIPKILEQPDPTLKLDLCTSLQYGLAAGYPPLFSFIRQFTREVLHPNVPYKDGPEILFTNGNTDGISKVLNLTIDPWYEGIHNVEDRPGMITENFAFGNTLTQAQALGVQIIPAELDHEGLVAEGPGGLRDVLENWDPKRGRRPSLLYTVSMGHNPSGGVSSIKRKKEVYAVASEYDILILEDEPYWYLQFPAAALEQAKIRGEEFINATEPYSFPKKSGFEFVDSLVPSYLNIDIDGRVIRLDTFSKTVAPGCRLGWITAQPALIERFTRITEATTSQPSGFVQALIAELVKGPQPAATVEAFEALSSADKSTFGGWQLDGWVRWLAGLRGEYERRMTLMCSILEANTYQLDDPSKRILTFDWPRGGMFIWAQVHFENHQLFGLKGIDIPVIDGPTLALAFLVFTTQAPHLVLGSPGTMFSATPEIVAERGWQYVRLCFAAESDENIDNGSRRYANALQLFWKIDQVSRIEELIKEMP